MICLLSVVLLALPSEAAQHAEQPAASLVSPHGVPSDPVGGDLPVSLERIQRALSRSPAITLKDGRAVFRVEILGRKQSIEDILGADYLKGPVPAGGMSHREFLDMVTPQDYQGYAAFNNREAFAVAATSFALKWALQKAIHKYGSAKEGREREAARQEVQDALAELERARVRAGLSPK